MSVIVIIGAQWGDEGKGKVVDLYSERADLVVRYSGGANAGHTLVLGGEKLVTHLIPSGVLHPATRCVLGNGMAIDPETLLSEIDECKARGLLPNDDLVVSEHAHVILPYHKELEALREKGEHAIGTTRRGIGPAYEAKVARRGVRVRDLLRPERLRQLIEHNLEELAPVIAWYGGQVPGPEAREAWLQNALQMGRRLERYIGDAGRLTDDFIRAGKNVLFEGAQGTLLDIDQGTYPYVTSSTTVAAGACHGTGIGPTRINKVIGIAKAYLTRVGGGPFPTELHGEIGEGLRAAGAEFGATTGRPRRCGWLDVPALRLAVRVNGLSGLALTKLDVLSHLKQVQACMAYRVDGREVDELPVDPVDIERAEPVYQSFPGWEQAIHQATSLDDLPAAARSYISVLEQTIGVPFYLVSVGPDRNQTIKVRDAFA